MQTAGNAKMRVFQNVLRQKGVTFLELLVTIAIIGILAAIAVPYYGDYIQQQRLVGAAEALFGQIQLAKRNAISNNRPVSLVISGVGTTAWCASYSEDTSQVCENAYVTSSSANPSVYAKGEEYASVVSLTASSSALSFVMPGVSVSGASSFLLSIPAYASVQISVGNAMQVSICSNELNRYPAC